MFFVSSIKKVNVSEALIIERFGKFYRVATTNGLTLINPLIDKVRAHVSLKEDCIEIPYKEYTDKSGFEFKAKLHIFYRIVQPELSVYAINNLEQNLEILMTAYFSDIALKTDSILTERLSVASELIETTKETLSTWGCTANHVSITSIEPINSIEK